ncbi:MAG: hypothetical protein KOO62_05305 [candidate division Zixibacteria bacterium]|nr:hypothetical protein [candidate division Zixibacteria bacterium]
MLLLFAPIDELFLRCYSLPKEVPYLISRSVLLTWGAVDSPLRRSIMKSTVIEPNIRMDKEEHYEVTR